LPLRFGLKPEQPGISFYQLNIALADSQVHTNLSEATLFNNSRLLAVDRGKGPHRILYISGRPNWEYKFMNRAVSEDPQLQLVGLIRIAKREPKFTFRGHSRGGSSSFGSCPIAGTSRSSARPPAFDKKEPPPDRCQSGRKKSRTA